METTRIVLGFEGLSTRASNEAALELKKTLERVVAGLAETTQTQIDLKKESSNTQDFGATLVVVLGTPTALAIAKGIHDYIAKRGNRVVIKTETGEVLATGDGAKNIDVAATIAAFQKL